MKRRTKLGLAALGLVAAGAAGVGVARRRAAPHEPDDDLELPDDARHHMVPSYDGGELHVVERGSGQPLVLLHGITLACEVWAYQLRDLSDRFRVVACDLRGHGSSTAGADGFGLDRLARDVATVLDTLDLRDAIVVGHSMGGMVLMRFCGDHPDVVERRVSGVVFLSTAPHAVIPDVIADAARRVGAALLRDGRPRLPRALDRSLGLAPTVALRRGFGLDPVGAHVAHTGRIIGATSASNAIASGIALLEHDAADALRATHTPALVVVGSHDVVTPPAYARRIAELLPSGRLVVVERGGHQLMLERRVELAGLLRTFADEARAA